MGKMIGLSLHCPMAVSTSGVNRGPAPDRPIKMLGLTYMQIARFEDEAFVQAPKFVQLR